MLRIYISYKSEDLAYVNEVLRLAPGAFIRPPGSDTECYKDGCRPEDVREDILAGSEITLHLIGTHSAESLGYEEQRFIKRELQASLCKAKNGLPSGVLGVVLPEAINTVYKGQYVCPECGSAHEQVIIDDSTVIREFSANYRTETCRGQKGCCVLAPWNSFTASPGKYIEEANARRNSALSGVI